MKENIYYIKPCNPDLIGLVSIQDLMSEVITINAECSRLLGLELLTAGE